MLPDIDTLKKETTKIHFFGLGFVQVKTSPTKRFHFYSAAWPSIMPEEEIHNHRYNFRSYILKGLLRQSLFIIRGYGNTHRLTKVSCDPTKTAPLGHESCTVEMTSESYYGPGSYYDIRFSEFHRVAAVSAITCIVRDSFYSQDFPDVVRHRDAVEVCPFSKQLSEDTLWEMVRSCY